MSDLRFIHKNTINKLSFNNEKNKNEIDILKKKRIEISYNHNLKKYRQSVLLDRIPIATVGTEGFHLVYEFYKLPVWAIPYVNVVAVGETEEGNSFEGFSDFRNTDKYFYYNFNYHWQPIISDDSEEIDYYVLYVDMWSTFREKEIILGGYSYREKPFFITIYIIYINDKVFYEIQKKKT